MRACAGAPGQSRREQQPQYIVLKCAAGAGRRLVIPHARDQPLHRHRRIDRQRQRSEQYSLLRGRVRYHPVVPDLQKSEQTENPSFAHCAPRDSLALRRRSPGSPRVRSHKRSVTVQRPCGDRGRLVAKCEKADRRQGVGHLTVDRGRMVLGHCRKLWSRVPLSAACPLNRQTAVSVSRVRYAIHCWIPAARTRRPRRGGLSVGRDGWRLQRTAMVS
jgi:hypothetical protein